MYRRICKVAIVLLLGLATLETGVEIVSPCVPAILASDPGGSSGGTGGGRI